MLALPLKEPLQEVYTHVLCALRELPVAVDVMGMYYTWLEPEASQPWSMYGPLAASYCHPHTSQDAGVAALSASRATLIMMSIHWLPKEQEVYVSSQHLHPENTSRQQPPPRCSNMRADTVANSEPAINSGAPCKTFASAKGAH